MKQDSDHDITCAKLTMQLNAMKALICSRQRHTLFLNIICYHIQYYIIIYY